MRKPLPANTRAKLCYIVCNISGDGANNQKLSAQTTTVSMYPSILMPIPDSSHTVTRGAMAFNTIAVKMDFASTEPWRMQRLNGNRTSKF